MATVSKIMTELKKKGKESTRKIYARHGAGDNCFGVSVADMKVIAKSIKGNQELACELYETGNFDAMYLAGLVADGSQMNKKQLDQWARNSGWQMVAEYTVPWVATESKHAKDMAAKWIKSKKEHIAASGWGTYSSMVAHLEDEDLDLGELKKLLKQVEKEIDAAPNRVRYTMNGFVIAVGHYVKPLVKEAKATAKKIGKVEVSMGDTACKVPLASEYIAKNEKAGRVGKKRKNIKC